MQNSVGDVDFFRFWLEIPFLGKLGPKNQTCQFTLKFGNLTNVEFKPGIHFFCLTPETPFLGIFGQNCHFKLKFGN